MDALRWLRDNVQNILPGWEVSTPDANEIGNIMYQVIGHVIALILSLQIRMATTPTYYMK